MSKVRFHLPGIRYNFPLNMFWVSLLKTHPGYFRDGVEIASFFGAFPFSLWNGGRLLGNDQCDAGYVKNVIRSANAGPDAVLAMACSAFTCPAAPRYSRRSGSDFGRCTA